MLPEELASAIDSPSRVVQVSDDALAGMKAAGDVAEVSDLAGIADLVAAGRAQVDGDALVFDRGGVRRVRVEKRESELWLVGR
ncbi:hypothetical protein [Halocynthiibacter styelae]|uniref:Uncharacterized protein n=1 Tax=Halocynthiibacter styelae TaxID=2761955 RepID=A0A8J7ILV7_9RHOB|nr:hypothetical protein [Paenihalocynthiibacter styelae]MBI1492856.1 hypothetical protein [Paenihalocynthiibacter styelae]